MDDTEIVFNKILYLIVFRNIYVCLYTDIHDTLQSSLFYILWVSKS